MNVLYKNEENFQFLKNLIARVTEEKLKMLQSRAKAGEKRVNFNITDEIVETIGLFVLRLSFAEGVIDPRETISILVDGQLQTMEFNVAFRKAWVECFESKMANMLRCLLLDPLTEGCLSPSELRAWQNQ